MNRIKYELILIYHFGLNPIDVIALGYSRNSAYRYHKYYLEAIKKTKELLKK
jgi:hypothetical protein